MDHSSPGFSVQGIDSPGKNTGVVCHALLQGIFQTKGSNPQLLQLLHWKRFFTTSETWEAHVTCIISFNPHYSVVRFIISYSFYKQGKQSWEVRLLTQDHTMNDRDAIKSRSVLTLKPILFLLCYTACLSKYIWLCQVNDKCYIFDVYSYIYISYLTLVIASKIGCNRDDYHQFIDGETFVT